MKKITIGIVMLLVLIAGAQDVQTNALSSAEDRIAELLGSLSDPFRFTQNGTGSGVLSDNLIPIDASQLAVSVRVKGILMLENEPPCALVQVGGDPRPQLVRENDLILLPDNPSGRFGFKKSSDGSKYLLVSRILRDSILVAPKKSPETVITIR